jgi:hypothetical protein
MSSSPAAAKRLGNAVEEIGENITGMQGWRHHLFEFVNLVYHS